MLPSTKKDLKLCCVGLVEVQLSMGWLLATCVHVCASGYEYIALTLGNLVDWDRIPHLLLSIIPLLKFSFRLVIYPEFKLSFF